MKKLTLMALGMAIMGTLVVGCTQEAREQYSEAGQHASEATKETGNAMATDAEKTGAAAAKTAEAAGEEAKHAAENTKAAGDNALETSKVKTALDTANGLATKDINVDTDSQAKTITLKGSVPDEKQKAQAETVAKGIAGTEFKVVNNLTVGPGK